MSTLRSHAVPLTATAGLSLSLLVLVGCGGGGGTTAPPDDPEPVLDFAPVAGAWSGSATESNGFVFFIDATIESSARRGEKVGEVIYRLEADGPADCSGRWLAQESDDPVFVVLERIGGNCPPGTVTLELIEAPKLRYAYTPDNGNNDIAASGNLTRE